MTEYTSFSPRHAPQPRLSSLLILLRSTRSSRTKLASTAKHYSKPSRIYYSTSPTYNSINMSGDGDAVPAAQKAGWGTFLKQITSATGDLSNMTAPPFILSFQSLLEFPAYWGEPIQEFLAIPTGQTPEERQLLVTKWFLATLSGQFTRREKDTGSEKKPLNPFLGEQFIGEFNNGEVKLYAEQVSHHPPVTGYHLEGPSVTYAGNCAQKTSFSGRTIVVKQVGHGILTVALADGSRENYLITLPKLKIEGLWFGAPYVELADTSVIQGSHGLTTTIEYSGKGWVSGKAHSFKATVAKGPHVSLSNALYVISGEWTGESHYVKGSPADKDGQLFLNAAGATTPISVKPIEEQNEYESRRAWKAVADGIRKGDFDAASVAKTALENAERQKRKDEAAAGTPFQTRLFTTVPNDPEYHKLAALCKHSPSDEDSYAFKGVSA